MNDIVNICGVNCYEKNGVAYLELESVARGLGFAKTETKNGKEYTSVMWDVIQKYMGEMGFDRWWAKNDYISENVFYRLAMKVKSAAAEAFQAKIEGEVIPSLHNRRAYMTEENIDKILSPGFGIKLLAALKEEREKCKELEAQVEKNWQIIKDFNPIKQYVDTILESRETMSTSQIAKDYGIKRRTLNKILREEGVQHNVNGQWILYRKHMGMGYTKSKTIPITRSDGSPDTKMHTQWTQKGRMMIHEILTRRGIKAVMDKEIEKWNGERKNGDELMSACGVSGTCIRVIV